MAQKLQHYFLEEVLTSKAWARSYNWDNSQKVIDALSALPAEPKCADLDQVKNVAQSFGGSVINNDSNMPVDKQDMETFKTSRIAPFAARLNIFESHVCGSKAQADNPVSLLRDLKVIQHDLVYGLYGTRF